MGNFEEIVLFQGDSITDCGRDREAPESLGRGYPLIVAGTLSNRYLDREFSFINRGIGGNRVKDLEARWDTDCIALKPSLVSILIGINDTWRRYDKNDPISVDEFESTYRRILTRVRDETKARIILLEPFLLPVRAELERYREDLDPKIHAIRKLSREFGTLYVPLDGLFAAACVRQTPSYFARDGIHPTPVGHGLIAKAWMDTATAYYGNCCYRGDKT